MKPKILVIHGPNLNMLGIREPEIYGNVTLKSINEKIKDFANNSGFSVEIIQSNHEGKLVDAIHSAYRKKMNAIVINPGALTHYGLSLRDALLAVSLPVIEVHISNLYAREEFRKTNVITPISKGVIMGFGAASYLYGLKAALDIIS